MTTAQQPATPTRRALPDWAGLLGFLAASYGVAALGALATASNVEGWYAQAEKPPLTPPNWLFGPTWTVLYACIAVSGWLVWRSGEHAPQRVRRSVLGLWWLQLALNLAWTPVFFALELLWPGLAVILALDVVVLVLIIKARHVSRLASGLLVPYLVWIMFASWLNAGVAWLS